MLPATLRLQSMTGRLPWILWAYVLGELWKLVLLTSIVLVTVIAFAAAIKPLADGKLDPLDTFKYMLLAMVPMLQYALPFAACFGATMAYHRVSSENELTAAYAGGVSHRMLLVPAMFSGVVLACVLLFLSQYVSPRMWRQMASLVAADASRLIATQIERGQAVEFDNTLLYADKVVRKAPDEAAGLSERLWLGGVLIVKLDREGKLENQGSARSALVWLKPSTQRDERATAGRDRERPATEVIIQVNDLSGTSGGVLMEGEGQLRRFLIPNALRENPKFLTGGELGALREYPERIDNVDQQKRLLARRMSERDVIDRVRKALKEYGQVELKDEVGQRVLLRAGALRNVRTEGKPNLYAYQIVPSRINGGPGKVVVERVVEAGGGGSGGKVQRQTAESALLLLPENGRADSSLPTFSLELRDVAVEHLGDAEVDISVPDLLIGKGEAKQRPISDLTLAENVGIGSDFTGATAWDLMEKAEKRLSERPAEGESISRPLLELKDKVQDLLREVLSKSHERYAQSLACLVMVLVGSIMAMRLRDALPLTIYLWAFFPALATVLAISGGQQLTHNAGVPGLVVLYGGVAALLGLAAVEFTRLSKH